MIVGITGPSGAGKSSVCKVLSDLGYAVIDCDKLYHKLISSPSPCVSELKETFGDDILAKNGGIDRKKLGNIVFSDAKKLQILNEIAHRHLLSSVKELLKTYSEQKKSTVIDAPLLFESGYDKLCDITVSLLCCRDIRTTRLLSRDGITLERLNERLDAGKPDTYYIERSDLVINVSGNITPHDIASRIDAYINQRK